jgi:glycosyltransferase involved in cell wall biosynthesis
MARSDVAIYLPSTAGLYDGKRRRSAGAERQMVLLAEALSVRGLRVAQVVWPIAERLPSSNRRLTLIERAERRTKASRLGFLREAMEIWRALAAADAKVVVVRKRQGALLFAVLYCGLRRRRMIFSSANDSEFMPDQLRSGHPSLPVYKACLRLADAIVVQSDEQVALAQLLSPKLRKVIRIPSFAEGTEQADRPIEPDAFIWIGRAVEDKRPLLYVDLARALPEADFIMIPVPDISHLDSPLLPALHEAGRVLPNLRVLDPRPHADVARLISGSVAVVNTTALNEGMPNTFLEGWAAGVPALTLEFDPDGVVARHQLGVSAKGSWEAFVEGAQALWAARNDRTGYATRVRAYIADVHSVDAVARKWMELIAEIA